MQRDLQVQELGAVALAQPLRVRPHLGGGALLDRQHDQQPSGREVLRQQAEQAGLQHVRAFARDGQDHQVVDAGRVGGGAAIRLQLGQALLLQPAGDAAPPGLARRRGRRDRAQVADAGHPVGAALRPQQEVGEHEEDGGVGQPQQPVQVEGDDDGGRRHGIEEGQQREAQQDGPAGGAGQDLQQAVERAGAAAEPLAGVGDGHGPASFRPSRPPASGSRSCRGRMRRAFRRRAGSR